MSVPAQGSSPSDRARTAQTAESPSGRPRTPPPTHRQLRGYAFDPSLATQLETALVSEITYKVPWEKLEEGPVGEYVEVVDFDPPSDCFYAPVRLDDPEILAQDGLPPSEGNPQFHQQMVYAVAMTTIDRFERALGRKAFWTDRFYPGPKGQKGEYGYVPRLRIYPHAIRMANAYYSRRKGAVLLGYFPATEDRTSGQFPGGMIFTCLSHDVVAHEVAHALLDGFHEHFMEPTNPDVLAFHEAFADIVALFQHFTFTEVLEHQIARTRGDLASENYLAQLASQVGFARGRNGALRDFIGGYDKDLKRWVKRKPDPTILDTTDDVHGRGAILVAAVFDAFLSIYKTRTRDLVRIATGGTGELAAGELHPDLVRRLAQEASKAAAHVLNMCIRALDYCPPVDLEFGEYLRALITADMDLMPEDQHGYRVAFIEAFRRWGIYPQNVRTLSEDSLRWRQTREEMVGNAAAIEQILAQFLVDIKLRKHVEELRYLKDRKDIWTKTRSIRHTMFFAIRDAVQNAQALQQMTGLALAEYQAPPGIQVYEDGYPKFFVKSLVESRRMKEDGRALNQVFVTIIQTMNMLHNGTTHKVRCGSTIVIDLDDARISYVVRKGIRDQDRLRKTIEFREERASLAMTYFGDDNEQFAALHGAGA